MVCGPTTSYVSYHPLMHITLWKRGVTHFLTSSHEKKWYIRPWPSSITHTTDTLWEESDSQPHSKISSMDPQQLSGEIHWYSAAQTGKFQKPRKTDAKAGGEATVANRNLLNSCYQGSWWAYIYCKKKGEGVVFYLNIRHKHSRLPVFFHTGIIQSTSSLKFHFGYLSHIALCWVLETLNVPLPSKLH